MKIEITDIPFNPWIQLQHYEQTQLSVEKGQWGAVVNFVGTVRNHHQGDSVTTLFLEHYPGMTERCLQQLAETALQQWEISDVLVMHRVGQLQPNETIVLIAVWAAHRQPAFEACRFLIEELKAKAPFWKQETLENKVKRWVKS